MFDIEDNAPPPPVRGRPRIDFPFRKMAVGQSFFVPESAKITKDRLRRNASAVGVKIQIAEAVRGTEKGVRVWRMG